MLATYCSTDEDMLQRQKLFCLWFCCMEQFACCTVLWWCHINTNILFMFKSSSV